MYVFGFVLSVLVGVSLVLGQEDRVLPEAATLTGSSVAVSNVSSQTVGVVDQQVIINNASMGGVEAQEARTVETPEGRKVRMRGSGQVEGQASQYSSTGGCNSSITRVNLSRSHLGAVKGRVPFAPQPRPPKPECPLRVRRPPKRRKLRL